MATDVAAAPPAAPPAAPTGHPIGFWFIFWGEFAERCSYYGMRAILATYMAKELGYGEANAGTYMSFFIAACYFLPLVGGYVADNFFGKYWTIVGFSLPYILGQFLVGFPDTTTFVIALGLLAMGSGVIKPNISTLMGITYDQQRPGNEQLRNAAFSWFYVAVNIGALLGQLGVPYAKDHYGYRAAFLVPAVFMAVALTAFALGKRHYAVENVRQRSAAATATAAEKLQFVLRVSGLFVPVMMFWAAFDQTASTWVFFGTTYMHPLDLGVFTVSAEQLQFANAFFIVTLTPVVRLAFSRLAAGGVNVSPTRKMFVGFLLTAAASGILAFAGSMAAPAVEQTVLKDGKEVVERVVDGAGKVTMWWMVLAYFVLTVGELLISVTGLELAFVIAPPAMKGFVTALWLLMVWGGNLLINAPITRLYPTMPPANYFGMLAGATVVAGLIFLAYAVVVKPTAPSPAAAPA
ncbi:MAG: oligopeptide:H+ symporter [Gemmataceae bacterium]|nr:oligopeptide:H+ symporter [Gemmataceae bacterium]